MKTSQATAQLGRSRKQLMGLIDRGILEPGYHFLRDDLPNSPITWSVERIEERLIDLSKMPAIRKGGNNRNG